MSHTTRVRSVQIKNLHVLKSAVEALARDTGKQITYQAGGSVQLWSETRPVAATISVPGTRFNVGFEGNETDGYSPIFDAHGGELARVVGGGRDIAKTPDERNLSNIGKLMQYYTREMIAYTATSAAANVSTTMNAETGEIVMNIA